VGQLAAYSFRQRRHLLVGRRPLKDQPQAEADASSTDSPPSFPSRRPSAWLHSTYTGSFIVTNACSGVLV
jgi:hypothetical protein